MVFVGVISTAVKTAWTHQFKRSDRCWGDTNEGFDSAL